jgi:hypothetical protein
MSHPVVQLPPEGEGQPQGLNAADAILILMLGASGAIFILWISREIGVTGAVLDLPVDFKSAASSLWTALGTSTTGLMVWLIGGRRQLGAKYLAWSLVLAILFPVVAIAIRIVAPPDCPPPKDIPYGGEWNGHISWNNSWADTLFNYQGKDSTFRAVDPRSEGTMFVYRSGQGVYKGFSRWETKNADDAYSILAVFPSQFLFDTAGHLTSIDMKTAIRQRYRDFPYGPFQNYRFSFSGAPSSSPEIHGAVLVLREGRADSVGAVVLSR